MRPRAGFNGRYLLEVPMPPACDEKSSARTCPNNIYQTFHLWGSEAATRPNLSKNRKSLDDRSKYGV